MMKFKFSLVSCIHWWTLNINIPRTSEYVIHLNHVCESESHSVVSDSLWPHGLYHEILQARILEWVAFLLSRGSSKSRSPTLQVDSLPAEPPGKPKNTGVGSLPLLQGVFLTQELNRGLLHFKQILYQLSYQGSPIEFIVWIYTNKIWYYMVYMLGLPPKKFICIKCQPTF